MSLTGLDVFDRTVHETNLWLKGTMQQLDTEDRHVGYAALKAVLHALRDRIGPENSVHLGAQLPMLLRGIFYEGWRMAGTPTKERHTKQFLDHVSTDVPPNLDLDCEKATKAVFSVIWEKVDAGEVSKLIRLFPKPMRELWPVDPDEEERT